MKKHPLYLILFSILNLLLNLNLASCNTTEPQPPQPPDGNTELKYDWQVDTLFNPHGYGVVPWSMWGSSPTDVWIAGFNLAGQGELFHYDGLKWKRVTPDLGFNYDLASVYGFSENDVYAAGYKIILDTALHTESLILHYNGNVWQIENLTKGSGLLYIHGQNTNDIWACGKYGTLYHKTNNTWQKLPFDKKYNLGPIWVAPNNDVFMMYDYNDYPVTADTTMFYFSKFRNNIWQTLDSCRLVSIDGIPRGFKFGEKAVVGLNSSEIYSTGQAATYRFDGSNWQNVSWDDYGYRDLKYNNTGVFFAVGDHGTIRYLLNNQWKRIGDYSRYVVDFYSVMPFKDEIFLGAYSAGNGYVVHGRLKK